MTTKSLEIEPLKYKGSVSDFRAWMDKFLSHGGGNIAIPLPDNDQRELMEKALQSYDGHSDIINFPMKAMNIDYSSDDKEINREIWYVYFFDPKNSQIIYDPNSGKELASINNWATIMAIEQPTNNVTVEFLDGVLFRRRRKDGKVENFSRGQFIGEYFRSYSEFIKTEWEKSNNINNKNEEPPLIKLNSINSINNQDSNSKLASRGDMTKAFISYSWDSDDHKDWVRNLAIHLREDGIDVTLDQWHLVPGDQLTEFMERAVRESDYVLIICTQKYRERSNSRQGGVGYEGDIITAEIMTSRNQRKFIPILRQQSWGESAPNWLAGKKYIDLSSSLSTNKNYHDLLTTLLGTREKAPPIGTLPKTGESKIASQSISEIIPSPDSEEIQIVGIIADQVGIPKNDGSRGSALYKIPFRLSKRPTSEWADLFLRNWKNPPRFTSMHRPRIASVVGDTVILDGTTIEEVKDYHRDTLVLVIQETNKIYKEFMEQKRKAIAREQEQIKSHKQKLDDISNQIKF